MKRWREREIGVERERERGGRERQRDRQSERQTERERKRETERQRERGRGRGRDRETRAQENETWTVVDSISMRLLATSRNGAATTFQKGKLLPKQARGPSAASQPTSSSSLSTRWRFLLGQSELTWVAPRQEKESRGGGNK